MKKPVVHSDREHAQKSPSSASRWWECTASISMEEKFGGDDKSSPAAEEGTGAHELLELSWKKKKSPTHRFWKNKLVNKVWPVTTEMADAVQVAYDYMVELELDGYEVYSEIKVPIACTGEFGTIDIFAWNPETKHLVCADYKHGNGIFVHVEKTKQLPLYALGVIDHLQVRDKIERLTLCIIQPRMKEDPSEYEQSLVKLFKFEKRAYKKCKQIDDGDIEFAPSESNCFFCKAASVCKARAEFAIEQALLDFDEVTTTSMGRDKDPRTITPDEVNSIMLNIGFIRSWINSVSNYAHELAQQNLLKDFKIVKASGNRKWIDPDNVVADLIRMGYDEEDVYKKQINGIGAIEKLFFTKGDSENFMSRHTFKPEGKQSLVAKSDPRKSISLADLAEEFDDI